MKVQIIFAKVEKPQRRKKSCVHLEKKCSYKMVIMVIGRAHVTIKFLCAVYFDQLLGAVCNQKLVKTFLGAVLNFYVVFRLFSMKNC